MALMTKFSQFLTSQNFTHFETIYRNFQKYPISYAFINVFLRFKTKT